MEIRIVAFVINSTITATFMLKFIFALEQAAKVFLSRINPNNDFVSSVIDFAWIIPFDISSGQIFKLILPPNSTSTVSPNSIQFFSPVLIFGFLFDLIWVKRIRNRFHLFKPPSQIKPRVHVGPSNSNKHLAGYCV